MASKIEAPAAAPLFALAVATVFWPLHAQTDGAPRPLVDLERVSLAIEALARQVNPAVVEVAVSGYGLTRGRLGRSGLLERLRSGGSGFIVDVLPAESKMSIIVGRLTPQRHEST